jgi:hypothetical protein
MPQNICRHIRPSGRRCQTPAVRNRALCYFHQSLTEKHNGDIPAFLNAIAVAPPNDLDPGYLRREPHIAQYYGIRPAGPADLDLPPLEDRDSIQIAVSTLCNALAQNRLDHRRAATLFYGLQIAVANLRSHYPAESGDALTATPAVDVILNEHGQLVAPPDDPACALPAESAGKEQTEAAANISPKHPPAPNLHPNLHRYNSFPQTLQREALLK